MFQTILLFLPKYKFLKEFISEFQNIFHSGKTLQSLIFYIMQNYRLYFIDYLTPKALGFSITGGVFHPFCKIWSRQPRGLKPGGLIVYTLFYKICQFERPVLTNDVINKNSGKIQTSAKPNKSYIIKVDDYLKKKAR